MQHNTFKSAILPFTKAIKTVYFYSFYFTKFSLCPSIHIQKNTQFEDFMKISSIHQKLQQNELVTFTVFPPSTNLEKTSEEMSFCWSCLIFIKQFGCCLSLLSFTFLLTCFTLLQLYRMGMTLHHKRFFYRQQKKAPKIQVLVSLQAIFSFSRKLQKKNHLSH